MPDASHSLFSGVLRFWVRGRERLGQSRWRLKSLESFFLSFCPFDVKLGLALPEPAVECTLKAFSRVAERNEYLLTAWYVCHGSRVLV